MTAKRVEAGTPRRGSRARFWLLLIVAVGTALWFTAPEWLPRLEITREPSHKIAPQPELPLEASIIKVPIAVPIAELAAWANAQIPQRLADDKDTKGSTRSHLVVERRGPVLIAPSAKGFRLTVPLHFKASGKREILFFDFSRKTSGDVTVFIDLGLSFDQNWQPDLQVDPGFHWDKKPYIKIGPAKMGLAEEFGKELKKALEKGAKDLDKDAAKSLNLREPAEKAWRDLFNPRRVGKEPPVWMVTDPQAVYLEPLRSDADNLYLTFALEAKIWTAVGAEPPGIPPRPLPPLRQKVPAGPGFILHVPAHIDYDSVERALKKSLKKKRVKLSGGSIVPTGVKLYTSGDEVALGLDFESDAPGFWLDTRGKLYLIGTPVYDPQTKVFRFDNFHFTREVNNPLLRATTWVLQEPLRRELEEKLVFNFSRQIEKSREDFAEYLNRPAEKGIALNGHVDELGIEQLRLVKGGMDWRLKAQGNVAVTLVPAQIPMHPVPEAQPKGQDQKRQKQRRRRDRR
jgi:hypothetical protein